MTLATQAPFDPEIERLLHIHNALQTLVQRAVTLLDASGFPQSSRAAAVLAQEFEAELEVNLLRAYDGALEGRGPKCVTKISGLPGTAASN